MAYFWVALGGALGSVARYGCSGFAARWLAGEPVLNEELDDARWLAPAELSDLRTTEGLAEIVAAAIESLGRRA
jgi:NADH pyrophosphatase NudC (nudix superfamily)